MLNQKGFAITVILYAMVILIVAIFFLLLGISKHRYKMDDKLKRATIEDINDPFDEEEAFPGECLNPVYDGTVKTLISDGENVSYSINTASSSGDYEITITANDYYYLLEDGIQKKEITKICSIKKTSSSITCLPTKVYNGNSQEIAKGEGCSSITNGSVINAGNYTVTCNGDSNHENSETTCSMEKATPIISIYDANQKIIKNNSKDNRIETTNNKNLSMYLSANSKGNYKISISDTSSSRIKVTKNMEGNISADTLQQFTLKKTSTTSCNIKINFTPDDTTNYKNANLSVYYKECHDTETSYCSKWCSSRGGCTYDDGSPLSKDDAEYLCGAYLEYCEEDCTCDVTCGNTVTSTKKVCSS